MKNLLKKLLVSPWTALITLGVLVYVIMQGPTFVESVRLRYFDQLITSQPRVENNIWTVNIDEATINKYGQFPFKRDKYANLIGDLYGRNAGLVVWNILMPEADRQGGDPALTLELEDHPVILSNIPSDASKNTPKKPGSAVIGAEHIGTIINYPGIIANIPELERSAVGVGLTNTMPELDGVNRRLPLFAGYDGNLYPSLPLEVLRVMSNDDTFQVKLNEIGVEKMRIPSFRPITTDSLGRIWVDWSQANHQVSAVNLPKDFKKGIVIVGVSAAGIGNPVSTSMGAVWPQDMQAAVIGTLANNVNIERPDWAPGAELYALIGISLIILLLSRWVYVGLGVGILLLASLIPASMYVFATYKFLIDAVVPTAGGVLVMLHAYGVKFISEFLQKQQIKKQFGSYVSPIIVERLQKNPELIRLGGEEKMLTAVMTDMRNFTGLGEKYGQDVEGFTAIMNQYMTAIAQPVFKNDGCLIKFIGDASLHIHGAPLDDERHAYNAVKTTLEMIEAVGKAFWPEYFATIARLLKHGGKACVQSIVIDDALYERYIHSTDFIQQYIFPGGCLPCPKEFQAQAERAGLRIVDDMSFGLDYAETLRRWRAKFLEEKSKVLQLNFDERFMRILEFYLCYCEAAFEEKNIDVVQYTLEKV